VYLTVISVAPVSVVKKLEEVGLTERILLLVIVTPVPTEGVLAKVPN